MYSVPDYLGMLRLAKRSEQTITLYQNVLKSYARFLHIPLDKVHDYLLPENLIKYAASRSGKSERGTKMQMGVLHRYFSINGVSFDPLELNVLKAQRTEESFDKPLELETLQKMMDLGTVHTRAILSTLISTGMRAGECCQILLSDVKGDTIHIRPEIAKRRHGGKVYLTAEAREYLDLWLKDRDRYILAGEKRHAGLVASGHSKARSKDDQRLFACSYPTLLWLFSRLYDLADGEQGKYRGKITPHSCRKYFRTNAVKSMSLDLVEEIMRHTGYLNSSYVRMTDEEKREQFHAGEASLYITRADHRIQGSKLDQLQRANKELQERLQRVESLDNRRSEAMAKLTPEEHAAIVKQVTEELRMGQNAGH
jgi:integrase